MSHSTSLSWEECKAYFDSTKEQYTALIGVPQVNPHFALHLVFEPLEKRYDAGERSVQLFDAMMEVR